MFALHMKKFTLSNVFEPKLMTCLKSYDKSQLASDAMAGVIVGIVAIPLAIAFGIASGVGPTEGLVTAIIAGLLISVLGGSRVQIGGPTGAFIVIIYGIIQQFGLGGLMIATVMAGVMLIAMGLVRLGSVIKFVPYPVIVGFTGGIAVTIFSTQMNDFFGMGLKNVPANFVDKWIFYAENVASVDFVSLIVGVVSLLVIIVTPRFSKVVPGSLVAIIVATVAMYFINPLLGDAHKVATIGNLYALPSGIPVPSLPEFSLAEGETVFSLLTTLFPAAFTIAMLGAIESLLSAMVADGVIGDRHNSNTELIGQGVANVVVPFFGGIPATGAIARTMANINNGGRSPIAGVVHAVVLLLVLLFLGTLVGYIPMPCLAAVLIMVSYNMSGWRTFKAIMRNPKSDVAVLFTTFLLTVIFDLTIAIEIGLLLAVVLFLKRISESASVSHFTHEIAGAEYVEGSTDAEKLELPDGVDVYEIDGPFFFGMASKFSEMTELSGAKPRVRIIRMRKVPFIDSTGVHNLENLILMSHKAGIIVVLSGVQEKVRLVLDKAGITQLVGDENVCSNINIALQRTEKIVASN